MLPSGPARSKRPRFLSADGETPYTRPVNPHARFVFDSIEFLPIERRAGLHYRLDDDVSFLETLVLDNPLLDPSRPDAAFRERCLQALHLIGGISYYKTCLPKTLEVRSQELSPSQAAFWNAVYENGLGEFFYRNDIDFRDIIDFPATAEEKPAVSPPSAVRGKRVLVPVGGGKDSAVTAQLLSDSGYEVILFRVGAHPLITAYAKQAGFPVITVGRALSPELFKLNAEGALNGHIPITAYLSFLAVMVAGMAGIDAIAWSNERSAEEGNLSFKGKEINHQWSKSLEFERAFQGYIATHVTPDIATFSLLRPLSELAIAKLCARQEDILDLITSCNANWKILGKKESGSATWPRSGSTWCGACPKCAFSFALFAAFLPRARVEQMFGANLFAEESLLPLYRELLGISGHKPFECVGTPEETAAAFALAEAGWEDTEDLPAVELYRKELKTKPDAAAIEALLQPAADHAIPEPFAAIPLSQRPA